MVNCDVSEDQDFCKHVVPKYQAMISPQLKKPIPLNGIKKI
jgi:hypothetical protein